MSFLYLEGCITTYSPGCIWLCCHFFQVSLRGWERLQLPAQPPELASENTLCCRPPDLGSARVAWLPWEPVAPGGPHLEGHGRASLLHRQSSMCSDQNIVKNFTFSSYCRWSDFLSPKPWTTWHCSIWPPCKLWLWGHSTLFCPQLHTNLDSLIKVTFVCSRFYVFATARHVPHPGSHAGSRTRYQNPLHVWRFEQKFLVCPDTRKRDRYKELWVVTIWTPMMSVALSKTYLHQGCQSCCLTRQRLCYWEHQFWELVHQWTTTAYRWEWNTHLLTFKVVTQMAVVYKWVIELQSVGLTTQSRHLLVWSLTLHAALVFAHIQGDD